MRTLFVCLLLSLPGLSLAEQLNIAVAANFKAPLETLIEHFPAEADDKIRVSSASTGVLFTQIVNGAPYDIFLSADSLRPALLVDRYLVVPESHFTYALGELVWWHPHRRNQALAELTKLDRLAIANARTAPYGAAAQETLAALLPAGVDGPKLISGTNIAQTLQFVQSGNVRDGLVARSQMVQLGIPATQLTAVPAEFHQPIRQDAVVLKRASENDLAHRFAAFLKSETGRDLISRQGYSSIGRP